MLSGVLLTAPPVVTGFVSARRRALVSGLLPYAFRRARLIDRWGISTWPGTLGLVIVHSRMERAGDMARSLAGLHGSGRTHTTLFSTIALSLLSIRHRSSTRSTPRAYLLLEVPSASMMSVTRGFTRTGEAIPAFRETLRHHSS
uniref:Uncharacterized protein n=1 Tax=Mycena chlorophos TaxID=658473 RepID=A0ABQ0MD17_MYCCL|nr:predicted protein [Mycena chlorophos]